MDKKSKLLIIIFVLVILVSIFFTYKRSLIDRNFTIIESEEEVEDMDIPEDYIDSSEESL